MTEPSALRRLAIEPVRRIVGERGFDTWRHRYRTAQLKLVDWADNRRHRVRPPLIAIVSEPVTWTTGLAHFYWYFLDWLARERPSLRAHFHLDRLPARVPAGTALLHAWLQDPVAERDAKVYERVVRLESECRARNVPVIHPAAVLSNSRRDTLYTRLTKAGIRTPRTVIVDVTFAERKGGLALPILVRRLWGHGTVMRKLETDTDVAAWWSEARSDPGAWVAAEFVDTRSKDGLYRKYRYVMAGSRGCPRHLIVSPKYEVRPGDRVKTSATREEELAFVTAASPHHDTFVAACRALEFEIAGFDFSFEAAGTLIIWEVNPFPDLSKPQGEVGDYLQPTVERSWALLADFYAERAGLPRE